MADTVHSSKMFFCPLGASGGDCPLSDRMKVQVTAAWNSRARNVELAAGVSLLFVFMIHDK